MEHELASIVRCDCLERMSDKRHEHFPDCIGNRLRAFVGDVFHQCIVCKSLSECDQGATLSFPDDKVQLPVTEPGSVGFDRSIMYADAIGDVSDFCRSFTVAVMAIFHFVAGMLLKYSGFIRPYFLIYPFVGYVYLFVNEQPSGYLLRRPVFFNQQLPRLPDDMRRSPAIHCAPLFAELSELAGVLKYIMAVTVRVAFYFATNR